MAAAIKRREASAAARLVIARVRSGLRHCHAYWHVMECLEVLFGLDLGGNFGRSGLS